MLEAIRGNGVCTRTIVPKDFEGMSTEIVVKEVTWSGTDVVARGDQYVVRSIRVDRICESGENKPWKTIVLMNGGASNATGSSLIARMFIEAAERTGTCSETNLRVIVLPHLESEPRQVLHKEGYKEMATVLGKVLYHHELNPTQDLNLFGFSAGGAQMIALAAELGDKCKSLVLMDSAGLSDHPNLEYEFAVGSVLSVLKKYFAGEEYQGKSLLEKASLVSREIGRAWSSSRSVAGSLWGILEDVAGQKVTREAKDMGRIYGLESPSMAKIGLDVGRTKKMIDKDMLSLVTARVIYAPLVFARVVNDAIDGLGDPTLAAEIHSGKMPEKLGERLRTYLEELFVSSSKIDVVLNKNFTHSSVMMEEEYWKEVVKKFAEDIPQIDSGGPDGI